MKQLFILLFTMMLVSSGFSQTKKTDWGRKGLKGKVKEQIEICYSKPNGLKEISSKTIYKYDDKGNMIECASSSYDKLGIYEYKLIYKYDDKGNQEAIQYLPDGAILTKYIVKYDDKGNEIEKASYRADGTLRANSLYTYKYNDKGNMIEQACSGTIWKTIYDNMGNEIESARYDNETLILKYVCKYNNKGNKIEQASYRADGTLERKYLYKYDNKGNMIEQASYRADGTLEEKRLYKYDDKGNEIEQIRFSYSEKFGEPLEEMFFQEFQYTYY